MKNAISRKLRRKNDVLRKKIHDTCGAQVVRLAENVNERLESQFLEHVMAFETQYKKNKRVRITDKLGNPAFTPVHKIPEDQIEQEWVVLYHYMYDKGIDLQVCSPNIKPRELYRFATEELFRMKTDDISMPGMKTCFIYDEFYPDHAYDNQQMVVDYCIKAFFVKREVCNFCLNHTLTLNRYKKLSWQEFQSLMDCYHLSFNETKNVEIKVDHSLIKDNTGEVSGSYKALFITHDEEQEKSGKWKTELCFAKKFGFWLITNIQIEGIDFRWSG